METNLRSLAHSYPHLPFAAYLLFVAVFLGVQMFQGFSWLDIGMYMSGVEHFNSDPYASAFLGQWIMTYNVTGWLCRWLSVDSFMGLRVMHLIYVLIAQTIVYIYMIRYMPRRYALLGLLLTTLAHYGSYTELNYNDYSAFLLMLSLMAFHEGAVRNRRWLILAAGIASGAAVFFRIVNITYAAIPLLSCLLSMRWQVAMKPCRRLLFFYIGMAAGMLAMLALLWMQGLLGVFAITVGDVFGIFTDKGDSHGMLYVMRSLYNLYAGIVANAVFLILMWLIVRQAFRQQGRSVRFILLGVAFVLTLLMMNFSYFPSNITMGVCLMGCLALYFRGDTSPSLAHLYMMSLFMPLVMPAGSNAEPSFYGKELCFLALPLSLGLVASAVRSSAFGNALTGGAGEVKHTLKDNINTSSTDINTPNTDIKTPSADISVPIADIRPLWWSYGIVAFGLLFFNFAHKQMEDGNRMACRYAIDSALTRGILTTADNAGMHNYLLRELRPRVPRGSYMICQFSLPMVSLMECRPWAVYSTVYSTDRMNSRYISVAWQHTHCLPYVLIDRESELPGYVHILRQLNKIRPYRRVWTDGRYELYYVK